MLEFCVSHSKRAAGQEEVAGINGQLSYRCVGAPAAMTRFRPCAGGWRTDPSHGWLSQPAGGAPSDRCSTGSTPPMPAPRWWAARKTSAPPPKTVPGARPGPAPRRGPCGRLLAGPRPRRFCWWIWPWLWYRGAHPSLARHRGHLCCPLSPVRFRLLSSSWRLPLFN